MHESQDLENLLKKLLHSSSFSIWMILINSTLLENYIYSKGWDQSSIPSITVSKANFHVHILSIKDIQKLTSSID